MDKSKLALPKPNRSAAEVEFVLRNAKRKRGPELLRDLARAGKEKAPPPLPKTRRRAKRAAAAPKSRKTWL